MPSLFNRSLGVALVAAAASWAISLPAAAQEAKQARLLMNWFAQADQSGFWQAQKDDLGKADGVRITVLQGGPKIQTIPQVAAGQAEFGVANADDVLLARQRGAPVKAIFVAMDHVPYTFVYHPDPAVKSIADLSGRTFAVSLGFAYWEWVKKSTGLKNTREIPLSGDLSLFRNDPKMVQQGYSLTLPARLAEVDTPVQQIHVADLGYRPYNVLFTTDEILAKDPALVKATIAAVKKGWAAYIKDPSAVAPMLLEMNKQVTPAVNNAATKELVTTLLPKDPGKLGCMNDARWTELAQQLRSVSLLPAGFDEKQAYDRSLVPGC